VRTEIMMVKMGDVRANCGGGAGCGRFGADDF